MKNIFALVFALILTLSLTACGGKEEAAPTETPSETPAETPVQETTVLNVAASSTPHAVILEQVVDDLAEQGIDLQIHEYGDYIVPNTAVEEGEEDANYFQHIPYLESFNANEGTHLVSVGGVHIEPMGVYAGKTATLEELADGAVIAVPNDPTNEGRALLLLESLGLIKLQDSSNLEATPNDIIENPKNLAFKELEAAMIPNTVEEVDLSVINVNYALEAGFNPAADALAIESADSPYVNIVAVREGNEDSPEIRALVKALQSEEISKFIIESFDGAVVPVTG